MSAEAPAASGARAASAPGGSRERILDAARDLIARYGIAGMSLQLLADHVGLHKSTLFHHFADKRELVDAVTERFMREVVRRLEPLDSGDPPELEQLVAIALDLDDWFAAHPGTALFVVRDVLGPWDRVHTGRMSGETARFFALVADWLDRARRAGAVRPLSVRQAIVNLMALSLFHPALVDQSDEALPGPDPRGPEARRQRRRELRETLRRALAP